MLVLATLLVRLSRVLVRIASMLVPRAHRAQWRQEWEAEIQYSAGAPGRRVALGPQLTLLHRSSGAFTDAVWLRRQFTGDAEMFHDIRHVLRMLAARPLFALLTIGVLGLGIAASTAVLSVVDTLLLRPLPYPDADRLVAIWERDTSSPLPRREVASANFLDWRESATSFERIASAAPWSLDYTGGPEPEVFFATRVSEGFFDILGLRPLHGRLFEAADHQNGRNRIVVLGHDIWTRRFSADPSIVGKAVTLDGTPFEVVGVMPAWFDLPLVAASARRDVWVPEVIEDDMRHNRRSGYWAVIAKLRDGHSRESAQSELDAVSARLAREHPKTNATTVARVDPLTEHLEAGVRPALLAMLGAVALVLLIACANVANLMLARGVEREREFAIRGALGASRGRLFRQLLTESLILALAGTAAGLGLAWWMLGAIVSLAPAQIARLSQVSMDWRVLACGSAIGLATTICFGFFPALQFSRTAVGDAAKEGRAATGTRRARAMRDGLAVAEIALAMVLLVGAGLLLRSFHALVRVNTGFTADQVAVLQVFAYDRNNRTSTQRVQFFREALNRMRAIPGVTQAGAVSAMPFIPANINIEGAMSIEGRPAPRTEPPLVFLTTATDGYFETMGIPILRGRSFSTFDDGRAAPVAVVSESLARRHWGADDPIGSVVNVRFTGRPVRAQVIGVSSELRHDALDQPARDEIFLSQAQIGFGSMTFVVRTAGDPSSVITAAKQAVWSLDPLQTIYDEGTVPELLSASVAPRRFAMVLVGAFAIVALVLAAAGVYGVVSFTTSLRTREIGVRLALGATSRAVSSLVVGRALIMGGIGIAIGAAGSYAVGRAIQTMLFAVAPFDPITTAMAATLLLAVAAAASYIPARRAARVDPLMALRID